jgi:ribosomal protein L11 methyltransferase
MKWAEISVKTTHEATDAVANIFHDLGATGVVIEDPKVINDYRASGLWDYCEIPEEKDVEIVIVKAYLPSDESLSDKIRLFEQQFNNLSRHDLDKGKGEISWHEVQEEDWATSWKQYFHPIKVGENIIIKPSWEEYERSAEDIIIELDPGMAFGTGTHHTTQLCIRCLEEIVQKDYVVFDVGTGSGILSVAAAKLGATEVRAIDLDTVAVRVAKENIVHNKVEDIVSVSHGDLLTGVEGKADIIVANIIADVIIKMLPDIPARLKTEGQFVASGIISERLSDVLEAMKQNNFVVEKVIEDNGWVVIVARQGGV